MTRAIYTFALTLGLALLSGQQSDAGGRRYAGGHPYHNGYLFIPPASAYESVRLAPPPRYGIPAYYVPSSYLPPGFTYQTPVLYQNVPLTKSAGYYMGGYGYYHTYPW